MSLVLSFLLCFSASFSQQTVSDFNGHIDLNLQLKGKLRKNRLQKVKIIITNQSDSSIFIESWKVIQNNPIRKFDCGCYGIPFFCQHYWSFLLVKNDSIIDCEVSNDFEPSLPWYSPDDGYHYNNNDCLNKKELVEIKARSILRFSAFLYIKPSVAFKEEEEYNLQICYCGAPSNHQPRLSKLKLVSNLCKNR